MSIIQAIIGTNLTISAGGGGSGPVADFTIEWWQKVEDNNQNSRPWSVGLYPTQVIALSYEGHINDYYWINNSSIGSVSQSHAGAGWEHMAFVRQNSTVYGYRNGSQYFSVPFNSPITDSSTPLYVGTGEIAAGMFQGNITDLHIMKGLAKYTGNFTPSILPTVTNANSKFLLSPKSDLGTSAVDVVGNKTPTVTGIIDFVGDTPFSPINVNAGAFNVGLSTLYIIKASYPGLTSALIGYQFNSQSGSYSGTVTSFTEDAIYYIVVLNVTVGTMDEGVGEFNTYTGSYAFYSNNYFNYGASSDWAMDV